MIQVSPQRLLDLLISYKEFAVLDSDDPLIPQLAEQKELCHISGNGKLVKVYRLRDWLVATERETLLRKQSDARRTRSLAHAEAENKVLLALAKLNGSESIAKQFMFSFQANRSSTTILKSLIPGLTPEEIEAFYDKNY